MPWFKPLAGFSPIWPAVFVQTEHCALAAGVIIMVQNTSVSMVKKSFIYGGKVTKQWGPLFFCLTKNFQKKLLLNPKLAFTLL